MARYSETQCLHGGNSKPERKEGGGLSQIYFRLPRPDRQLRNVQPDSAKSQGLGKISGAVARPVVLFENVGEEEDDDEEKHEEASKKRGRN